MAESQGFVKRNTTTNRTVAAGDILWLSSWPASQSSGSPKFDIFGHPVMIWSVDVTEQMACVLVISSLGGKDLTQYQTSKRIRALHLPIYPTSPHPDTGELLFLHGTLQLPKNSYVKTRTRYTVPLSLLRLDYRNIKSGQRYRLRSDSLLQVRKAVDVSIPVENGMTLATASATKSRKVSARTRISRSRWKSWLFSQINALLIRLFFAFLVFWSLDWLIGDHLLARWASHMISRLLHGKQTWA